MPDRTVLSLFYRQVLSALQDELDHTKANAHLLLLDQNTEISQTIKRLDALSELMCQLDEEIEDNVAEWSVVRIILLLAAFYFLWSELITVDSLFPTTNTSVLLALSHQPTPTLTLILRWLIKSYLHVTSAFASNVKNGFCSNKSLWCSHLTF